MPTAIALVPPAPSLPLSIAIARLRGVEQYLRESFVERERPARILLLTAIARGNVMFYGPPGTAKSAMLVRFARCFADARTFDTLTHKQQPLGEIAGEYDVAAAQRGEPLRRVVDGTLFDADFAFLDEPGKASGAVLNPLLRALNERTVTQPGTHGQVAIPLRCVVMASNEVLDDPALAAFADRRLGVAYIDDPQRDDSWDAMLARVREDERGNTLPVPVASLADLDLVLEASRTVEVSESLRAAMHTIRRELAAKGIRISPRRYVAVDRLLRVAAAYDGASVASTKHLPVLCDALWDAPEQRAAVEDAVMSKAATWMKAIRDAAAAVTDEESKIVPLNSVKNLSDATQKLGPIAQKLKEIRDDVLKLRAKEPECEPEADRVLARISEVQQKAGATLKLLGFGV